MLPQPGVEKDYVNTLSIQPTGPIGLPKSDLNSLVRRRRVPVGEKYLAGCSHLNLVRRVYDSHLLAVPRCSQVCKRTSKHLKTS